MRLMDIWAILFSTCGLEIITHNFVERWNFYWDQAIKVFYQYGILKKKMAWAYRDSLNTCIWVVFSKASSHEWTPKWNVLQQERIFMAEL